MNAYNAILFLHVQSAFGILAAFALEWAGLSRLQRSCSKDDVRESLKGFNVLRWIGGPAYLIILLSGIYLWREAWIGSAWPVIAVISLIAIAVVGAVVTGPRMSALGKAVERGSGGDPLSGETASLPVLWGSLQVRTWTAIGITFLMTVKPGAVGSVVVMVISVLIGLAINSSALSYYRSRPVCAATAGRPAGAYGMRTGESSSAGLQ